MRRLFLLATSWPYFTPWLSWLFTTMLGTPTWIAREPAEIQQGTARFILSDFAQSYLWKKPAMTFLEVAPVGRFWLDFCWFKQNSKRPETKWNNTIKPGNSMSNHDFPTDSDAFSWFFCYLFISWSKRLFFTWPSISIGMDGWDSVFVQPKVLNITKDLGDPRSGGKAGTACLANIDDHNKQILVGGFNPSEKH